MLSVGSCFSGIGGLELGLERTGGFETKWQIEIDSYAAAVLKKHWPSAKRYADIRAIDTDELERVDLICGGYPCQPFSFAGKRGGAEDARHLWPDMCRIIRFLRPRFVLLENVPGHLSMGFGEVLGDLAQCGYDAEWQVLSAAGVGAPHLRRRIFILAHAMRGSGSTESGEQQGERSKVVDSSGQGNVADTLSTRKRRNERKEKAQENVGKMANTKSQRSVLGRIRSGEEKTHSEPIERSHIQNTQCDGLEEPRDSGIQGRKADPITDASWWATEPDVGRVAHGVPSRVDRLKCLGNAVVPQVAQKIGEMILKYEQANP